MSAPRTLSPTFHQPQRPSQRTFLRGLLFAVPVSLLAWAMLLVAVAFGPS
jgi:hypothetical protein